MTRHGWPTSVGLRLAGLALLLCVRPMGSHLAASVHRTAAVTTGQFLLAGACFLCASVGIALLVAGAALLKTVPVTARWAG
ncbi:hypothetical protein [Sphingobium sp. CCH11-B1]|uniref:hypothetical protein n=1 Tax=Sphingobium sp. CCH11-B1 TaxID=1768781 RepID=UPI0008355842|nr:hypothetical protein [Sphingobium sp. CCH11-B1]MEA3387806.1 hypothetical protein [Pseudomonadota bacterium]